MRRMTKELGYSACIIAVPVPEEPRQQIIALAEEGSRILHPDKDIYTGNPHITAFSLIGKQRPITLNNTKDAMTRQIGLLKDSKLKAKGIEVIEGYRALYAVLKVTDSGGLDRFRQELAPDISGWVDRDLPWRPHITLFKDRDGSRRFWQTVKHLQRRWRNFSIEFPITYIDIYGRQRLNGENESVRLRRVSVETPPSYNPRLVEIRQLLAVG